MLPNPLADDGLVIGDADMFLPCRVRGECLKRVTKKQCSRPFVSLNGAGKV